MRTYTSSSFKFIAVLMACSVLQACTIGVPQQPTTAEPPSATSETSAPADPGIDSLTREVAELTRRGHEVGVVILGAHGPTELGNLREGAAWSTAKVPLATAALQNEQTPESTALISAAISESDNAAADELWNALGTPDRAATSVTEVIHQAGDTATNVPSEQLQPEYSIVGQTMWGLAAQTHFLAGWRCESEAAPILAAMRNVVPEHSYGLGHLEGAAFKGGWGPGPDGKYLVRQMALVPRGDGDLAIAIAVRAHDGSYETGKDLLNTLADRIQPMLDTEFSGDQWAPLNPCPT